MTPDTPEVAAVDSLMSLLAERDAEIASLKDEVAKLTADYDAVLRHKWEWMQKHNRLADKVTEHEAVVAELEEKKATVLDLKDEISRLDALIAEAEKRYSRLAKVRHEEWDEMTAKLADARAAAEHEALGRKAVIVVLIGVLIAFGVPVLV